MFTNQKEILEKMRTGSYIFLRKNRYSRNAVYLEAFLIEPNGSKHRLGIKAASDFLNIFNVKSAIISETDKLVETEFRLNTL